MFNITLYTLTKKENSTARPSANTGTSFSCVLKAPSGILNPTIELDIGLNDSPANYNYAYIPAYDRYYWISEWINTGPLWSAKLKVDVLASYKNEIGNTDLYVLRSASNYDGYIVDSLYPTKVSNVTEITSPNAALWNSILSNGCFIVGVISDQGAFGGIDYYALTYSNMNTFIHSLLNDQIADQVNGFSSQDCQIALQKALIDPLSFIKSCIFLPYDDVIGTPDTSLRIWSWTITVDCKKISLNNTYINKDTKGVIKEVEYFCGDEVPVPEAPKHDGYEFIGWEKIECKLLIIYAKYKKITVKPMVPTGSWELLEAFFNLFR